MDTTYSVWRLFSVGYVISIILIIERLLKVDKRFEHMYQALGELVRK